MSIQVNPTGPNLSPSGDEFVRFGGNSTSDTTGLSTLIGQQQLSGKGVRRTNFRLQYPFDSLDGNGNLVRKVATLALTSNIPSDKDLVALDAEAGADGIHILFATAKAARDLLKVVLPNVEILEYSGEEVGELLGDPTTEPLVRASFGLAPLVDGMVLGTATQV